MISLGTPVGGALIGLIALVFVLAATHFISINIGG